MPKIGNQYALKHGHGYGTATYKSWCSMRGRCLTPSHHKFAQYGARGIKICDRWASFANFLADMGERPDGHTLDRINPDGDYSPENCRWAGPKAQARNRTNKVSIVHEGREQLLIELCEKHGVNYQTAYARLKRGLPSPQVLGLSSLAASGAAQPQP